MPDFDEVFTNDFETRSIPQKPSSSVRPAVMKQPEQNPFALISAESEKKAASPAPKIQPAPSFDDFAAPQAAKEGDAKVPTVNPQVSIRLDRRADEE